MTFPPAIIPMIFNKRNHESYDNSPSAIEARETIRKMDYEMWKEGYRNKEDKFINKFINYPLWILLAVIIFAILMGVLNLVRHF